MARKHIDIEVAGRTVRVSNPDKEYFRERGETKLQLVEYFLAVGPGVMRAVGERPVALHRFPDGALGKSFYHKRVPDKRPDWLQTVEVRFPSARPGELLCPADLAHVIWAVNLGAFELHPWPVKRSDLDHPDELRIDLDPQPGSGFAQVRRVAMAARELLAEHDLLGFPKVSGSRGLHIHVPIARRWEFTEVRNACVALARELERRMPDLATAAWWKEERGARVFVDFNQNLRDKTICAAYAVRPKPSAPVACPIHWDELDEVTPDGFTIATVPARFSAAGDPLAERDDAPPGDLSPLLAMFARDLEAGLADAPWPPHYPKQSGEPPRVAPSRAKKSEP